MSKKGKKPALYELMRVRMGMGSVHADERPGDIAEPEEGLSWLGPGRALRLPVGYLFLALAGALLLAVIAYMIGYQAGARAERAEYDDRILGTMHDPLVENVGTVQPNRIRETGGATPSGGGDSNPAQQPESGMVLESGRDAWGAIDSDPRQAGYYYYCLVTTTDQPAAQRLAEFCRSSGLEAYVIARHNRRNVRVIVLPGFQTQHATDPAIATMRARILDVGRKWKALHSGHRDLRDSYLELYQG